MVLIVLLAVVLYIPPIQEWAVDKTCEYASMETGMDISVGGVHLAFPLDLSIEDVRCMKQNDSLPQVRDSIALIGQAIVDVQLLPLLNSEVVVNQMELNQAHFNTSDFVHEARVRGYVGRLLVDNTPPPVATVSLDSSMVRLSSIILADAHLNVELSDTVPEDTTESENLWKIYIRNLAISNADIAIHTPGDTMLIATTLKEAKARDGFFDLDRGLYQLASMEISKSLLSYDNNMAGRVPFSNNPVESLDPNHIAITDLNIAIDSIYYCDPDIRLLIRHAAMSERSGLALSSMRASIAFDKSQVIANGIMATPESRLALNFNMSPNPLDTIDINSGRIDANIDASIGRNDLIALAMETLPKGLSLPMHPLEVKGEAHGNMTRLNIPRFTVSLPTAFTMNANGEVFRITNVTETRNKKQDTFRLQDYGMRMHTDAQTFNLNFLKALLDRSTAKIINIPAMRASADIKGNGNLFDADLKVEETETKTRGKAATITAQARMNIASGKYDVNAKATNINVGHFVKGYGNLNNINATASLKDGVVNATIDSHSATIFGNLAVSGRMGSKITDLTVTTNMQKADLYKLKVADMPLTIAFCGHLDVATDMDQYYKVQGTVSHITVTDSSTTYHPDDVILEILTRRDTTAAKVDCGDFALRLNAQGGYKWLLGCTDRMQDALDKQFKARTIDQQALREFFPRLTMSLHSGRDNPIYRSMKYIDVDFSLVDMNLRTSREDGIFGDVTIHGLETQGYKLDTISLALVSSNDPMKISYQAHIQNRPPNEYVFDAHIDGKLLEHGIVAGVRLFDNNGELALRLGAEATMEENGIKLHLVPKNPTLGYDEFLLNEDNYVLLAKNNRIHANIDLLSHDGTGIKVYCTDDCHNEDLFSETNNSETTEEGDDYMQDLTLSVNKLNIGRLLASLPYAVNVEGILNGDFHILQNSDESFTLSSDLNVNNMVYEGCEIGNIGSQFTYLPKSDGSHFVDGILTMDGTQVGDINGSYNFDTSAIDAKMNFEKFPLQIINGFVTDQIIGLEGTAEGTLAIQGTTNKPDVNGELFLENAALLSVPYGVRMRFDDDPVRIHNSQLLLENFQMYASNDEPLLAHGSVDFADLDHIKINLRMRAENFALIDAKENGKSEAYGQMYVNFFAMIKGELDKLMVRGKVDILPSTNLYYILRDSPITTDNRLKELVTFTDLENGDTVTVTRPTVDGMDMNFSIAVREGAHIKCWLDGAHSNYLDLIGNGELRYIYANEETKLNGRYTISEGEMKYSLPVIPLKTFTIEDGSYIEWTGEMMNPRLHITAKETVKSNVNVDGVNQMVTFNTGIVLSKTLSDMGLEFIIEAPENQTISDELNMKSAEERGKLAVTMLTTGMYLSDGNTSNFSMNSAMNSFLQSQINNIAGSALKTIDLSFGMESSTEQDGTMHNDYTFKFAKRFWNNRLSISVGGKVSSGPDVSGQNKSFFNNVELQYRLSDTSNQYLQAYYKRSVYDYLEGYLSEYGAGYMWKKKSQTFKGIFKPEKNAIPAPRNMERRDSIVKFTAPPTDGK